MSSSFRKELTGLVGAHCLERRPGRDPLTGALEDGHPDTDDSIIAGAFHGVRLDAGQEAN